MLGSDIIVRPVVEAVVTPATSIPVEVWLPPLEQWVDWNTSAVIKVGGVGATGGVGSSTSTSTVTVDAAVSNLPMFVRAGAVLPLLPVGAVDVMDQTTLVWAIFSKPAVGSSGHGYRYLDDDSSTGYQQEHSSIQQEQEQEQRGTLMGGSGSGSGSGVQNFTYTWASSTALTCIVSSSTFVPTKDSSIRHVVELRGIAPTPSTVTFNGVAGSVSTTQHHSLSRPVGTVVLTSPDAPHFTLGTEVKIEVAF